MESRDLDWGALFNRYRPLALRIAVGLARESDGAEDLVQEAMRAVLERARSGLALESEAHARNYLLRTLRNLAIEGLRRPRPPKALEDASEVEGREHDPLSAALAEEGLERSVDRLGRVQAWIDELRDAERVAVRLRYGVGLSLREISERTGVPISTLGERIQAALAKIRRKAGRQGGLP